MIHTNAAMVICFQTERVSYTVDSYQFHQSRYFIQSEINSSRLVHNSDHLGTMQLVIFQYLRNDPEVMESLVISNVIFCFTVLTHTKCCVLLLFNLLKNSECSGYII